MTFIVAVANGLLNPETSEFHGRFPNLCLVVNRNDKLGDSLCTTPLLTALHEVPTLGPIYVFGPASFACVFEYHPSVHGFAPFVEPQTYADALRLGLRIRRLKPTRILLTRPNGRLVAIAGRLCGAPVRVGMVAKHKWYSRLLTVNCIDIGEHDHHTAERFLRMGEAMAQRTLCRAPMQFEPPATLVEQAKQSLKQMGAPDHPIVLHLGGGGANRALTSEKYVEIARGLSASFRTPIVLTGDSNQRPIEVAIRDGQSVASSEPGSGVCSLLGNTDLTELAVLFRSAKVVVGVDTGAMHLAAAVGTPIVDILPKISITPEEWFPWQARGAWVRPTSFCEGCTTVSCNITASTCIDTVSAEEVIQCTGKVLTDFAPLIGKT